MLQTAAGEPAVSVSNLLKEIESDKPTGLKRCARQLQFSKHAAGADPAGGTELVVHRACWLRWR